MAPITYKNLYTLIVKEIETRVAFNNNSSYDNQTSREQVSSTSFSDSGRGDVSTADLVNAIQDLLSESLPSVVISGLQVVATTPISNQVIVDCGKGSAGGQLYELEEQTTLTIPFDDTTAVYYITLYKHSLLVEKATSIDKLTIAKIVVPNPGVTSKVQDTKDSSWNAYIVNFKEYKLYGYNDKLEEDSIELLRSNISPILADNLIGNLRL
jgi:hypothetical protein